jgi:phospholipid-binding lipoprotein MlaA
MEYMKHSKSGIVFAALLMLGLLSGCATTQTSDSLEGASRVSYDVNDSLDKSILQPIAKGYARYTPKPVRVGVTNFFDNITYLNVILNDLLQGKFGQAFSDSGRFVVNTTIGVLGLFDVATSLGLEEHDEDLGQTFGVWGAGEGTYLVLPFFGPNSLRDAPDLATSSYLNPLFYLTSTITIPLAVLNVINGRANLLEASAVRDEAALDPYTFTREAYRQQRMYDIYDGSPPDQGFDQFIDEGDQGQETNTGVLKLD